MDNFFLHSFEISVKGNFIFHSFALSLLPSSLKLRLNASSKHGDTLPSVFSINKKKSAFFWHSSIFAPEGIRTHDAPVTGRGCLTNEAMRPLTNVLG